ncbi:putative AIM2 family protein C30D10.14 [Exophiala dermatitidis]|uniref:Carboxymethylenebutenolidase n=1 Tax=Exophiala dermatitidis (strain ATCC 34100 / CBS 525.76 / NIH/UT8656) TaxID=858893 RepID=H6BK35_EXODN|nr:carboxymethylenebutenolidase [Exophiala dermatitidis NIH/UT8656]EHY53298.1 carboxymethylenebutenolidase [Exophiala dermatitidis NIH/UT8656]
MSQSQTPSAACCNTPAVVSKGYKEKGSYTTVDGLKTYTTGPSSAKKGILVVYDIFGFFPQTIQGVDILAYADKDHPYQIFMPDFFEGEPADISWYPPDTEEKGKKLGEFFQTKAAPPKTVERVKKVMEELKSKHPHLKEWGVMGYCWGGKIVNLVSQAGTPFKAAAACHPAMVDPNDAPNVAIPMLMIPSKDEDKAAVEKYEANLKVPKQIEWYNDQIHGFMAARGDLENPKVKAAYEKAYQTLLNFFNKYL